MRPAMRRAKKKKVKTPGGRFVYHRISSSSKDSCGVCCSQLQGSRRARVHANLCVPCARKLMQEKVRVFAQEK